MRLELTFFVGWVLLAAYSVSAQVNPVLQQISEALKSGDATKVGEFFNKQLELNFDDDKAIYSKNQAEIVLKDFLQKNPPVRFEILHQGAAKEGRLYAIGKYQSNKKTFTVYVLLKQVDTGFKIDTLDFAQDN